jgi:hypothetical protein
MKIAIDGSELGRETREVEQSAHNILTCLVDLRAIDTPLVYSKESLGRYDRPNVREQALPPAVAMSELIKST